MVVNRIVFAVFGILLLSMCDSALASPSHSSDLGGVIAAIITPFDSNGKLDLVAVEKQAASVRNLSAVYVAGTTGESMSLTIAERKQLAEKWVQVKPNGVEIIVHVGTSTLLDSIELARHAQSIGADAIGSMPPFFFTPPSVQALVAAMKQIADAAPKLPFYYYHIPGMTHVTFPVNQFLSLAKGQIPNLRGAKFSDYDLKDFSLCLEEGFTMFIGKDEIVVSARAVGASGAVGSTYNFASPVSSLILDLMEKGDLEGAKKQQMFLVNLVNLFLSKYGDVALSAQKAMMKMLGCDLGLTVRLPLLTIDETRYKQLEADLREIGFFDYIPRF